MPLATSHRWRAAYWPADQAVAQEAEQAVHQWGDQWGEESATALAVAFYHPAHAPQ